MQRESRDYRPSFLLLVSACSLLAIGASSAIAADAATLAAGELQLALDAKANVTGIAVGITQLPVEPAPLVTLCDVEQGTFHPPAVIGGEVHTGLSLRFDEAKASAVLTVASQGDALRFAVRLEGDDLPARGLLLRFALPWDASGWLWHNDMQTAVPIGGDRVVENVVPLRAWADLPEWKDQPELRMGYSNRNFCTVLTGAVGEGTPVGVCLAVPIDRPCTVRTAYDGKAKRLELVYDFALSPDTRAANEVEFAFDLYACDPAWGFRSGLARYYRLYPELFVNLVKEPGQWMPFSRLSEIDNANEFGFGLQEGAPEPDYDDKLGVLSTTYFTHAGMGARIPDHDPENDPLPPHEVQVEAMEAAFKARTGMDGLYHEVGLHDAGGRLDVRRWRVYAHLIAQFNLDPELPYGAWTLRRAVEQTERIRETRQAALDGFYYDGLSAGINYRPDQFKTADAPCLWDPVARKPLLNNFFSSCEFARAAAELLRPRGQITMMNGALGASFYVVPWLDVLGAETGVRISRERLNYIRATTYHKPFLTLLKGNFEQDLGREQIEQHIQQCLAYGVVPGFFDWMPSGLGPGGRYWAHPRYYERDRDLFRKYLPLCRALAAAGWEPVTYARSSDPKVFVERFGPAADGIGWLTLLCDDDQPHTTTLTTEAEPLNLDPQAVRAVDVVAGTPLALTRNAQGLSAEVEVPSRGVMAVQLATPVAAARWRIRQALDTLDRGMRMRELDKDKPPLAVHWLPGGKTYSRGGADDKPHLVFTGDGHIAQSADQWVMLFQPQPAEVTLRVRARAEELAGSQGNIGIGCRLAWVTPSYTHYETRFFDLPAGTYDWKDFEFAIQSPHALRAIRLTPGVGAGVEGTLRLARVSMADAACDEYVVDPELTQWYDPLPADMQQPLEDRCRAFRTALVALEGMAEKPDEAIRRAVGDLLVQLAELRAFVAQQQAENGCRRLLRDLETIERHLKFLVLSP